MYGPAAKTTQARQVAQLAFEAETHLQSDPTWHTAAATLRLRAELDQKQELGSLSIVAHAGS